MARPPGIHLLKKPLGATSFATLNAFLEGGPPSAKKAPKACHGGALDPFAEGLLLALVGPATHLFEHLHVLPKTYEVELSWGTETDNGDLNGAVVATGPTGQLTPGAIETAARAFVGWHDQVPPTTSNKKVGGEPAYRRVHRGEEVVLAPSRVYLHSVDWLGHALPETSRVRIVTRGGFYVRSFVRDLARSLGTRGHVSRLARTAIGPWLLPAVDSEHIAGPATLAWARTRPVSDFEVGELRQGRSVGLGEVQPARWSPPLGYPLWPAPETGAVRQPEVIGAVHHGRLIGLLAITGGTLTLARELRGGV